MQGNNQLSGSRIQSSSMTEDIQSNERWRYIKERRLPRFLSSPHIISTLFMLMHKVLQCQNQHPISVLPPLRLSASELILCRFNHIQSSCFALESNRPQWQPMAGLLSPSTSLQDVFLLPTIAHSQQRASANRPASCTDSASTSSKVSMDFADEFARNWYQMITIQPSVTIPQWFANNLILEGLGHSFHPYRLFMQNDDPVINPDNTMDWVTLVRKAKFSESPLQRDPLLNPSPTRLYTPEEAWSLLGQEQERVGRPSCHHCEFNGHWTAVCWHRARKSEQEIRILKRTKF